jgi:hypothetical protein
MEVDTGPLVYTVIRPGAPKPSTQRVTRPSAPKPQTRPPALPSIREFGDNVYFIVKKPFDGKVKIGHSNNPRRRLSQLQTGNDCELRIYRTIPDVGRLTEGIIHNAYAKYRRHGEWFELTLAQVDEIIGRVAR